MFDEYNKLNFRIDISLISMFILIKMYIMLLVVLMYIVVKEKLEQYYSLIEILIPISQAEIIVILLFWGLPVIYNIIVWFKKKKLKED